jgi:hypothetical protein
MIIINDDSLDILDMYSQYHDELFDLSEEYDLHSHDD